MSHPGLIQALPQQSQQSYNIQQQQKQQQQQQQQQQPSFSPQSEAIEMRPTAGFTRLPQDPPPTTQQPYYNSPQMETTMSNGVALRPSPDYSHPPSYTRDQTSSLPFSHHHNYEELPTPLPPPPNESSTDDVNLEERQGFPRQGSHTEVDQYFNPPVHSISSTPLTIAEPEKKPRKKVNPIYDRYQGPTERITTSKVGSPKDPKKPHRSFPGRCLRHPITTAFIFVLVAVLIVAIVLIMLGTIETPASMGSSVKQVQPTMGITNAPVTSAGPDINAELMVMLLEQKRVIDQLQIRINSLENMLGGGEVNASLSTRVAMNTIKVDAIEVDVADMERRISEFESTTSNFFSNLEATKIRTSVLENNVRQLNTSVGQLSAKAVTQSTGILENKNTNDAQRMSINTLEQNLSNLDQKFGLELAETNRTIFVELSTISKMQGPRGFNGSNGEPGPPGPAGAGDLSMCEYMKVTDTTGFSSDTFGPVVSTPSDKVITGFTCSTDGGVEGTLTTTGTGDGTTYRCKCSGGTSSSAFPSRVCYTHYWQCPKTS